jgi:hypothetical protein
MEPQIQRLRTTSLSRSPLPRSRRLSTNHSLPKASVRKDTVTAGISASPSHVVATASAPRTQAASRALQPPMASQWRRVRIASPAGRGGRLMMSAEPLPTPRARAGKTSVSTFRYRICNGRSGRIVPAREAAVTTMTSARFVHSMNITDLRMFAKITRP